MAFSFTPTQSGSLVTTLQRTQPPWLDAMHQQGAGAAQNYFQNYQSNPSTMGGLNAMSSVAQNPNQTGYNNVMGNYNQLMSGANLYGGAGFNAAMDAAQANIQPRVAGAFNAGGRLNSGLAEAAMTNELGNVFAGLYDNERNRQMSGLAMAPQMFNYALQPGQTQYQVGQLADNEPESNLDDYLRRLQAPGELYASESTEQPLFENDLNSLLGSLALGSSALFGNGGGGLFGNDGGGGGDGGLFGSLTSLFGGGGATLGDSGLTLGDASTAIGATQPLMDFFNAINPGTTTPGGLVGGNVGIDNSSTIPGLADLFNSFNPGLFGDGTSNQPPINLTPSDVTVDNSNAPDASGLFNGGYTTSGPTPSSPSPTTPTVFGLDNPYGNAGDFQNAYDAGQTTTISVLGRDYEVPNSTLEQMRTPGARGRVSLWDPDNPGSTSNINESTWQQALGITPETAGYQNVVNQATSTYRPIEGPGFDPSGADLENNPLYLGDTGGSGGPGAGAVGGGGAAAVTASQLAPGGGSGLPTPPTPPGALTQAQEWLSNLFSPAAVPAQPGAVPLANAINPESALSQFGTAGLNGLTPALIQELTSLAGSTGIFNGAGALAGLGNSTPLAGTLSPELIASLEALGTGAAPGAGIFGTAAGSVPSATAAATPATAAPAFGSTLSSLATPAAIAGAMYGINSIQAGAKAAPISGFRDDLGAAAMSGAPVQLVDGSSVSVIPDFADRTGNGFLVAGRNDGARVEPRQDGLHLVVPGQGSSAQHQASINQYLEAMLARQNSGNEGGGGLLQAQPYFNPGGMVGDAGEPVGVTTDPNILMSAALAGLLPLDPWGNSDGGA